MNFRCGATSGSIISTDRGNSVTEVPLHVNETDHKSDVENLLHQLELGWDLDDVCLKVCQCDVLTKCICSRFFNGSSFRQLVYSISV